MTWTNVELSTDLFCGIHMGAINQEVLKNFSCNWCSEITLIKLLPHLPGDNDLIKLQSVGTPQFQAPLKF